MFYLSIQNQLLADALHMFPFDEEVSQEFMDDLYDEAPQYKEVLPPKFYDAMEKRILFSDENLLQSFQTWCANKKIEINKEREKRYERHLLAADQLHSSARELMKEGFHDGEILVADFKQNDYVLFLDMSGGFLPHSYVKCTFTNAQIDGNLQGYYLYDELIETKNGFALRILSSFGRPYSQATISFKDVIIEGVFRPAIYTEPGDVATWEAFQANLNPDLDYYIIRNDSFILINLNEITESDDGIFAGVHKLGANYEEARGQLFCGEYENPYAYLSEPVAEDDLYRFVVQGDDTEKVRALNTLFARGTEVAPIVRNILNDVEKTEENEMYFFVLANHFNKLDCLEEELWTKWK